MYGRLINMALGCLSSVPMISSLPESCHNPHGHALTVQPIILVKYIPVTVNITICFPTVLNLAGKEISLTNVPTTIITKFTVTSPLTYISTENPTSRFEGIYSTVLQAAPAGYEHSTFILAPSGTDSVGTKIICTPTDERSALYTGQVSGPIPGNEGTLKVYTTLNAAGTNSVVTTVTLAPAGTDGTGTQIVLVPTARAGGAFTGPYTTLTAAGTNSVPTTLTLAPAGTDGTGTQIVLSPTFGIRQFFGPYVTIIATGPGTITSTLTFAPAGSDTTGTQIILVPSPVGTLTSSPTQTSSPIFTAGPTLTSTYDGSVTLTTTLPVGPSGEPGSVIVLVPSALATLTSSPTSTTGPSPTTDLSSTISSTASPTDSQNPTTSANQCVVTSTASSQSCTAALPAGCSSLSSTNGLALIPVPATCTVALGPFAVGKVATCLATSVNLFTSGQTIATCVLNALQSCCPTTLPQSCVDLQQSSGLALVTDVAQCAIALGPFAVGSAATCLATGSITALTQGTSIFQCLELAFGLGTGVVTITDPALCPTARPTAI